MKKTPKEKNFKKTICISTSNFTLRQFSVPANQPPGSSVRGTSIPIGYSKQWVKILMGYTKRLHQLKHCVVLFHLKSKILNFLLTIKMSYLYFRYVKTVQSTIT